MQVTLNQKLNPAQVLEVNEQEIRKVMYNLLSNKDYSQVYPNVVKLKNGDEVFTITAHNNYNGKIEHYDITGNKLNLHWSIGTPIQFNY